MTLIVLSTAIMLVVQLALWVAIKRFRQVPDGTDDVTKSGVCREAAWWLAATIIVVILLGILVNSIYRAQRAPAEAMLTMRYTTTV